MDRPPETWNCTKSETVADCRVFNVREDVCRRTGSAGESNFFVIDSPDWVNIVALTPSEEVVLIEQYRHGTREVILEIPGGMVDPGEAPEAAAARELAEETGYEAREMIFLGSSRPNPAIQNNTIHHFLANGVEKTKRQAFDEHEDIAVRVVPYSDVHGLVGRGQITHALAITGFYYVDLFRAGA